MNTPFPRKQFQRKQRSAQVKIITHFVAMLSEYRRKNRLFNLINHFKTLIQKLLAALLSITDKWILKLHNYKHYVHHKDIA